MAFNINEMKAHLVGGGARQALFQVTIRNPANGTADGITPFMVNASSLPSSDLGMIPVYYFGRQMKLAGDRTFADWSVTVLNDEDFKIRNAMEQWSNAINARERNVRDLRNYKSSATVRQYGKEGNILREYRFEGIFPASVSAIDVDWSNQDSIESFNVTFQYDYWTIVGGETGTGGNS